MEDNVIILAGGQGKRMKIDSPKALCNVVGEPMLEWVIRACENAGLDRVCVVKGFRGEQIDAYLENRKGKAEVSTVMQEQRLGTGHAVMQAVEFLKEHCEGNTLVLCGDAPFIDAQTIKGALELHKAQDCGVTVVTSKVENPFGYGRIIRTENGISGIVEHKDCTPEQLEINEINSGCYWFKTADLLKVLFDIKPENKQGEYYLTDCIELIIKAGSKADAYISQNPNVSLGANDRKGLLMLNDLGRMSIIDSWLAEGIEFTCLDGVSIGADVKIGLGTTIHSGVVLKGDTVIGENCQIGPNAIVENSKIGKDSKFSNAVITNADIEDGTELAPFTVING